ncbi:AAA family ATPase [Nocardiopsis ganjiahuensis]|uniref:AAA family ATPase n=1 Tax=Nocardiopsis ganjiahuensis TaxID=239984 RepID=UPI000348C904|nr:AAA family ATPase [Nocardiopsis ganjiahuensis]
MSTEPGATDSAREIPGWWIFHGTGQPRVHLDLAAQLPPPPPWRTYSGTPEPTSPPPDVDSERHLGPTRSLGFAVPLGPRRRELLDKVNAAIHLRRPLLLVGPPGIGKSSLAHQIARELKLGRLLRWSVTSRATVGDGLYTYDPLTQIHDLNLENTRNRLSGFPDRRFAPETTQGGGETEAHLSSSAKSIGRYLTLGPLGTAFLPRKLPRVLLVDDFDLGDFDLSGDLLDLFENGGYRIPELARLANVAESIEVGTDDPGERVEVHGGEILCSAFPIIVLTCNTDRDLPPAFLRRCIPVRMGMPEESELLAAVAGHFRGNLPTGTRELVGRFLEAGRNGDRLALDQLLNAVYLLSETGRQEPVPGEQQEQIDYLAELLWHRLTENMENPE